MAPQVLEKKIALLFTYRKIVIIFKSVELEHTPSSFPQSKTWSATVQSQKKKLRKGSSRRIYSCFFTHNGITTPKTTRGQESTTKTSLHFSLTSKVQEPSAFHSESSKQVPRSWTTSIIGNAEAFPILCVRYIRWERERERDTERERRKWRHHCRAKIGDEFCTSPCQKCAP